MWIKGLFGFLCKKKHQSDVRHLMTEMLFITDDRLKDFHFCGHFLTAFLFAVLGKHLLHRQKPSVSLEYPNKRRSCLFSHPNPGWSWHFLVQRLFDRPQEAVYSNANPVTDGANRGRHIKWRWSPVHSYESCTVADFQFSDRLTWMRI